MKYGLITFKETENIGDDIQSYVAIRFLPKIDYYVEREQLDLFLPKEQEQVITIMNGWFLHSKVNFPLSPFIYPLYISTHISEYNSGGIKTEYLNDYSIKGLIKYGPIGCRDSGTCSILSSKGVDNYFSGCMTLTIQADKKVKKKDYICLVDVEQRVEDYMEKKFENETIIKRTHTLDKEKNKKLSWDERFKNVKELLNCYQAAKLVITSRLHCALPCLALGTPVLLLYDEDKPYTKDRLADYTKYVTFMSTSEFVENGINVINNGVTNKDDYKKIREKIEKKVKVLIKNIDEKIYNKDLPNIDFYRRYYVDPKKNLDQLYRITVDKLERETRENIENKFEIDYWQKQYKILEKLNNPQEFQMKSIELNNMIRKFDDLIKDNITLQKRLDKYEKKNTKKVSVSNND